MASRRWQRKLCLSSSVKGRVSETPVCVLGSGIEFGPISLAVSRWDHSADALDQLACSPTVPVFHS